MAAPIQRRPVPVWLVKTFAFLSIIRWYNIGLLCIAQYMAAHYLLRAHSGDIINFKFHLMVIGSSFTVAAGYMINSFYDREKDLINKPQKALFEQFVSRETLFRLYFLFNVLGVAFCMPAGLRMMAYYSLLPAGLWLYSHKLQKIAWIGELSASLLTLSCFVSVAVYFKSVNVPIVVYAAYMGTLVFVREVLKGIQAIPGEQIADYHKVATDWGVRRAKWVIGFVSLGSPLLMVYLGLRGSGITQLGVDLSLKEYIPRAIEHFLKLFESSGGWMPEFLMVSLLVEFGLVLWLFVSNRSSHWKWINRGLKLLLLGGILAIAGW